MGLVNTALPMADANDTYSLVEVQKLRGNSTIKAIKASPGSTLTFKQALLVPDSASDPDTDSGTRLGAYKLDRSSKWFTISDCVVNDKGEIVVTFVVGSKTTATGRVARIGPFFSAGMMSQNVDFFYQIA